MTREERLIRSYFDNIEDINQTKCIKVLPLTLVDMLLEFEDILNEETRVKITQNSRAKN